MKSETSRPYKEYESDLDDDEDENESNIFEAGYRSNKKSSGYGPTFKLGEYFQSPQGYTQISTLIALTCSWVSMTVWNQREENYWEAQEIAGITSFFLFATITPWVFYLFLLTIMAVKPNKRINVWYGMLGYVSVFFCALVLAASAVLYHNAAKVLCQRYRCNVLKYVAASFGIVAGLSLGIQSYLHLKGLRNKKWCKRNRSSNYSQVGSRDAASSMFT